MPVAQEDKRTNDHELETPVRSFRLLLFVHLCSAAPNRTAAAHASLYTRNIASITLL
jgi:hypothetical protein